MSVFEVRAVAAIMLTVGLALLATACGGSPESHVTQLGSPSSQSPISQPLAFSHCMRSHGVRNFPDPNSRGVLPKRLLEQIAAGNPRFQTAQTACSALLPNGALPPGGAPTETGLQKMERDALSFSHCMRSHGVPTWPDYTLRGGIPIFDLHGTTIDPNAPQIVAKQVACKSLLHLPYSPPTSGG